MDVGALGFSAPCGVAAPFVFVPAGVVPSSAAARRFLNLVSVMGRKNVHSMLYCLQCAQIGCASPLVVASVGRISHLIFFDRYIELAAIRERQCAQVAM